MKSPPQSHSWEVVGLGHRLKQSDSRARVLRHWAALFLERFRDCKPGGRSSVLTLDATGHVTLNKLLHLSQLVHSYLMSERKGKGSVGGQAEWLRRA